MRLLKDQSNLKILASKPIPHLKTPAGWKGVNIHERRDRLVPINTFNPDRIVVDSQYYKEGYPDAMEECYARETVANLLSEASELLPSGWKIMIFDAWRPLALQKQLFEKYKTKLKTNYPKASEHKLTQETQKYISLPSSNPASPSPHISGGSVDLSLRDESGKNLNMGTEFDEFDEKSQTRYFELKLEKNSKLTHQEQIWLKNRRILFHTLIRIGFTNYPEEWWHFDYGNQFWARIKGEEAIYSIASLEGELIKNAP